MDFLKKYNPFKKPPMQDWKESVPVILLSEYLKMKSDAGIKLYNDNGLPCLCFNPGSRSLSIIEDVRCLFEDTINDLKELIANGKIDLPIKTSGSFRKVDGHTDCKSCNNSLVLLFF